ncbi:MAG: polyphenol oxidase family protein [Patescibacteria group bacterium]
MLDHPFTIFRPFKDRLRVAFLDRSDPEMKDTKRAKILGCSDAAALHQMHGKRVIRVDSQTARTEQADGMITDKKCLVLMIRAADCQNFVVFAPEKSIVGMMHVGWRGLEADIIGSFFDVLQKEFKTSPEGCFIGGGPSLCKSCADFSDPMHELPHVPKHLIERNTADLMRAADERFLELGVSDDRMERMPGCTRCSPEKFWTYRGGHREEVKAGKTNILATVLL